MTERQGTQDVFKHIMAAPPAEPLTLSPVDLMLLREWLRLDALEIDSLNAELAALHKRHVELGDNYHNDGAYLSVTLLENLALKAELSAIKPSWDCENSADVL